MYYILWMVEKPLFNSAGAISLQGIGLYSVWMICQYYSNILILSVSTRYHVQRLSDTDILTFFTY